MLGQLLSLCSYSEQVDLCTESQKEIIFSFSPGVLEQNEQV